jgi:hypothetical protein
VESTCTLQGRLFLNCLPTLHERISESSFVAFHRSTKAGTFLFEIAQLAFSFELPLFVSRRALILDGQSVGSARPAAAAVQLVHEEGEALDCPRVPPGQRPLPDCLPIR